ncbi:uncharacterized protein LOC119601369 [Lucilia sericata]|uniref:uncharacterized protein LOC119601369 n=1 Tax=Lucilia sericata TaxID=13632 RepID=UPI0018A87EC7|nr:uncharacterized protein LOC119601369 [Lucilia sericata]
MYDVKMESSDEDVAFSTTLELIIRTRLDMEPEFQEGRKKKTILWERVLSKIKETQPDFKMTKDQINRKFLNLMTTYRRIKDRGSKTGRNATSWEYFKMFDEVYGKGYCGKPPPLRNLRKIYDPYIKETKEVAVEKPQPNILPTPSERCEDVIFGELVSAMLKRMNEDKKKHAKKEIMNLLCS